MMLRSSIAAPMLEPLMGMAWLSGHAINSAVAAAMVVERLPMDFSGFAFRALSR
jgi:hypothetical protein